eukprot:1179946-Pleurochrysis_carterae.AAC.1
MVWGPGEWAQGGLAAMTETGGLSAASLRAMMVERKESGELACAQVHTAGGGEKASAHACLRVDIRTRWSVHSMRASACEHIHAISVRNVWSSARNLYVAAELVLRRPVEQGKDTLKIFISDDLHKGRPPPDHRLGEVLVDNVEHLARSQPAPLTDFTLGDRCNVERATT